MPPQPQQAKQYLSTDPNAGEPIRMGKGASKYISTDPNAGMTVQPPTPQQYPPWYTFPQSQGLLHNIGQGLEGVGQAIGGAIESLPQMAKAGGEAAGQMAGMFPAGVTPSEMVQPSSVATSMPTTQVAPTGYTGNTPYGRALARGASYLQSALSGEPGAERGVAGGTIQGLQDWLTGQTLHSLTQHVAAQQYDPVGRTLTNAALLAAAPEAAKEVGAGAGDVLKGVGSGLAGDGVVPTPEEAMTKIAHVANPVAQQMSDYLEMGYHKVGQMVANIAAKDKEAELGGNPALISTTDATQAGRDALETTHQAGIGSPFLKSFDDKWGEKLLDWESAKEARTELGRALARARNPADQSALTGAYDNLTSQLRARATELGSASDWSKYHDVMKALNQAEGGAWGDAINTWKSGGGRVSDFMNSIHQGDQLAAASKALRDAGVDVDDNLLTKRIHDLNTEFSHYKGYLMGDPNKYITGFFHKFLTRPGPAAVFGIPTYAASRMLPTWLGGDWLGRSLLTAGVVNAGTALLDKMAALGMEPESFGAPVEATRGATPEEVLDYQAAKLRRLQQLKGAEGGTPGETVQVEYPPKATEAQAAQAQSKGLPTQEPESLTPEEQELLSAGAFKGLSKEDRIRILKKLRGREIK